MDQRVSEVVRRPSRLQALASLDANAVSSAAALDRIAGIACRVLDVPVVLVNLIGADQQRFVGCGGPEPWASVTEMPVDRFDADAVWLLLLDESAQTLRTAAALGTGSSDAARPADVPLAAPLSPAEVVRTGEPDFLTTREDVRDRFEAMLDVMPGVGAVAVLPLTAGEQHLGALGVCFAEERAFSADDRECLAALGGVSGLALARSPR